MRPVLFLAVAILASCQSLPKTTLKDVGTLKAKESQVIVVQKRLDDKSRIYVDGALRALQKEKGKSTTTSKDVDVAIRLLTNANEIMGPPAPSQKLDVVALTQDKPDVLAEAALSKLESEHKVALDDKAKLNVQIDELHKSLSIQAEKLAIIQNRSWFDKLKDNIIEYVVIFGISLFLIFFGPMLFKIAIKLIKL